MPSFAAVEGAVAACDHSDPDLRPRGNVYSPPIAQMCRINYPPEELRQNRPRRHVVEMASLQAELPALTLQLKIMKQTRSAGVNALLTHSSYWRTEAKYQSRQRAQAHDENVRLRAQLQVQKKFAKRLMRMIKPATNLGVLEMLERYERASTQRSHDHDAAFDRVFIKTDSLLAAADIFDGSSAVSDFLQGQAGQIQFRRRFSVPCDIREVSDAAWGFRMQQDLREHFFYDQIDEPLDDGSGYTCHFQPRNDAGFKHFSGECLQRRYTMEDRIVIVRLFHVRDSSAHLSIRGHGCIVIEKQTNGHASQTTVRSISSFSSEGDGLDLDQDPRFLVSMDFLKRAFESYSRFTRQLIESQSKQQ